MPRSFCEDRTFFIIFITFFINFLYHLEPSSSAKSLLRLPFAYIEVITCALLCKNASNLSVSAVIALIIRPVVFDVDSRTLVNVICFEIEPFALVHARNLGMQKCDHGI